MIKQILEFLTLVALVVAVFTFMDTRGLDHRVHELEQQTYTFSSSVNELKLKVEESKVPPTLDKLDKALKEVYAPTPTPTVEPTVTPVPTLEPTLVPTVEPTLTPTVEPTLTPTVEPIITETPTVEGNNQ